MNNKSILVIDTPESCDKCPLFHGYYSDMTCGGNSKTINYPYPKDFRQTWCPLSPIPERKKLRQYTDNTAFNIESMLAYQYSQGWNDCIEEIMEES